MTLCLIRGLLRSGRPHQPRLATHAVSITRQWAARRACISRSQTTRNLHHGQILRDAQNPVLFPGPTPTPTPARARAPRPGTFEEWKTYFDLPSQSPPEDFSVGNTVTIHGCISKRRDISSRLAFVDIVDDDGLTFQFKSSWEDSDSDSSQRLLHKALKRVAKASAVSLTGEINAIEQRGTSKHIKFYDLTLKDIHVLNTFPATIILSKNAAYEPDRRHLQLKFDPILRNRLRFRRDLTDSAREFLVAKRFSEVETPILFKSTPEGAREFLVPTRRFPYAYALPQSPQQYKQILMASGTRQYYQFARCFRDEDLRADRQPEFTQLDLEMSFAKGEDVMNLVESLVKKLHQRIKTHWCIQESKRQFYPVDKGLHDAGVQDYPDIEPAFPRITYQEAMSLYGSDKPDLRIPNKIQRIEHILPESFISMITKLEDPIVEACVFRFDNLPIDFVKKAWDTLPKKQMSNADGQPAPIVIDPSKPLSGLSPLGHEAAEKLLDAENIINDFPHLGGPLEHGDLLVLQARPNEPFSGGSTALGNVRNHIYRSAVEQGLLPFDPSLHFLWVTGFPLFTPTDVDAADPGQGGTAGFSSTHHPFTAPLTLEDLDLLQTNPIAAKADHYDLVLNGVELGGGSRRIHVAGLQEYVFREVLKMQPAGIEHFEHLLTALKAGCPPHAGFAFGWDRLVATLSYTESVRDVIAFPKNKKGQEPVTNSPGRAEDEDWQVYGLMASADEEVKRRRKERLRDGNELNRKVREARREARHGSQQVDWPTVSVKELEGPFGQSTLPVELKSEIKERAETRSLLQEQRNGDI